MGALTLVVNPGSASRKYVVFHAAKPVAKLHFEYESGSVVCSILQADSEMRKNLSITDVADSVGCLADILQEAGIIEGADQIKEAVVRVVAPGSYFLDHHVVDDEFIRQLEAAAEKAPLHVAATLGEVYRLKSHFANVRIVGVSDSAFHVTKPDYAWNYGIRLEDADSFDIKRFGYHGLSAASVVDLLKFHHKLPPKVVVCHLGGGDSVTAVYKGKSMDTTMGYSPWTA